MEKEDSKGLGGWLILVGLGVVFSPIKSLVTVVPLYWQIISDGSWEALTTEGSAAYHPLWSPVLVGEITLNAIVLLVSVVLIFLFFSKHYLFPNLYIGLAIASLIYLPVDSMMLSLILPEEPIFDRETLKEIAKSGGTLAVWGPYLKLSKRAKATFVEGRPQSEDVQLPPA